jgi:hypothetical protein
VTKKRTKDVESHATANNESTEDWRVERGKAKECANKATLGDRNKLKGQSATLLKVIEWWTHATRSNSIW